MKKAFTLIELIISISIILIIISIGIFSLGSSRYYKARKDLDKIAMDIRYTRNLALANNASAYFKLRNDNRYEIVCGNIRELESYSEDLYLVSDNIIDLQFNRSGASSKDTAQTIYFRIKDKSYELTIEPVTGKVNLKKWKKHIS